MHLKFVVHFFKAISFALTRWSSGSCWNNVSSCAHALEPMYNGVLSHVLFPSKQKQINKLIKTREKIKSVLVKSLTSNSESSNLKFKELCLAFQNFLFDRGIFLVGYGTTATKKRLRINFFATLLQTELNTSEVARFTTNENKPAT